MAKLIDITDKKFNRLRVIKRAEKLWRRPRWLCECECGNQIIVDGHSLRSGNTKSCGCYHRDRASEANKISLIGKRFGRLLVVKEAIGRRKAVAWECECDCGNIKIITGKNLVAGKTVSCGCFLKERITETHKLDLGGVRFGRLKAVSIIGKRKGGYLWRCVCDCGNTIAVTVGDLRSGHTKSCGCLQRESASKTNLKHGMSSSPEYYIWCAMKQRCSNPANKNYHRYGGRGIKVCVRWLHSFENFFEDIGKRPTKGHSIDRTDNNGDYESSNCKWVLREQQNNNRCENKGFRAIHKNGEVFDGRSRKSFAKRFSLGYSSVCDAVKKESAFGGWKFYLIEEK